MIFNLYFMDIAVLPSNRNFNHNYMIFNCDMLTYKYICILVLTTPKMAT